VAWLGVDAPVVAPLEVDDPLEDGDELELVWLWSVDVVVLLLAFELALAPDAVNAPVPGGTLRLGVDLGTTSVADWLAPQALTTSAATATSASAQERMVPEGRRELGRKRRHAAPAGRAVVEVTLRELVAPRAEAQVLDRPRQLRTRGRERQDQADDLELLARLAVGVDPVGLGLDDDLASRRWGAQAVPLSSGHGGGPY
jgi:hypothetical protein